MSNKFCPFRQMCFIQIDLCNPVKIGCQPNSICRFDCDVTYAVPKECVIGCLSAIECPVFCFGVKIHCNRALPKHRADHKPECSVRGNCTAIKIAVNLVIQWIIIDSRKTDFIVTSIKPSKWGEVRAGDPDSSIGCENNSRLIRNTTNCAGNKSQLVSSLSELRQAIACQEP